MSKIAEPRIRSVKYNALMNMVLTSSSFIFPLITIPYVSRVLSTFGTGAVAFAQSIVWYFSLFAQLGIPMYGVRRCAQVRDDKKELSQVVAELLAILSLSTAVVFVVYVASLFLVPRMMEDKSLFLIFGVGMWLSAFGAEWFYQAIEQYEYITVRSIIFKFVGLFLTFIFVHQAADYRLYGSIVVLGAYGSNVINLFRMKKYVSFRRLKPLDLRRHLNPMVSFMVSSVSSGLYAQMDIVMLGFLSTTTSVGIYQLAAKVKNVLSAGINSIVNVMLPRLSYYIGAHNEDAFRQLLSKNLNFISVLSFAGVGTGILCADPIISLLGGQDFKNATLPLIIILPGIFLVSLNTVFSQYLIAKNHEKQYAIVNFVGLIVAFISNYLLIPKFGAIGAAVSVPICEFSALLLRCWYSKGFIKEILSRIEKWQTFLSFVLAFIPCEIAVRSIPSLNPFVSILFVSAVFLTIYMCLLLLFKEKYMCLLTRSILTRFRFRSKG